METMWENLKSWKYELWDQMSQTKIQLILRSVGWDRFVISVNSIEQGSFKRRLTGAFLYSTVGLFPHAQQMSVPSCRLNAGLVTRVRMNECMNEAPAAETLTHTHTSCHFKTSLFLVCLRPDWRGRWSPQLSRSSIIYCTGSLFTGMFSLRINNLW